uniref:Uncharacterized protein n=1 Tax=Glossina pallidipes TaxID=7398 RepID=A0A1B0A827_GLOPL
MAAAFCSIVFRSAVAKASNGSSTIKDNKLAVVGAASCVNADNEMRCFSIKYCNSLCNLSPKTYSHLSWSSGCGNGIQNFQERKALITEVIDDKSIKTLSVSGKACNFRRDIQIRPSLRGRRPHHLCGDLHINIVET